MPTGPEARTPWRTDSSARFIPRVITYVSWLTCHGSLHPAQTGRASQKRSASLGLPIAAALARRGLASPGSAATATREATGAIRALLSALHGGRHAAAL